jgi:hypothetical protein
MSSAGRPAYVDTGETTIKPTKIDATVPLRNRINAIKRQRRTELGRYSTTIETLEHIVAYYEAHHAAD